MSLKIYYSSRCLICPSKWYILFNCLFFHNAHNTCHNHVLEQCKWHVHINNKEKAIFIIMLNSQQHNDSTSLPDHSQYHITTIYHITLFSSLELLNMDKLIHHQFPLLPDTYYKEIHELHTVNKGLEIHLSQSIKNSLWNLNLLLSLNFKLKAIC